MMKNRNRYTALATEEDCDPISGLVNLFDAAMVFAVALMVAFAIQTRTTAFLMADEATMIKNANTPEMEIIVKKDNKVTKLKASDESGTGKGVRVGTAYRLETGEVIYVPEGE